MLVATKKIMSQQCPEAEVYKRVGCNKFCVTTQDIPIATRTRLLDQNSIAPLSNSVVTDPRKSSENRLRQKTAACNKSQRQRLKTLSRHNFLCRDRATKLGHKFGDPQHRLKVRQNIGKSINRLLYGTMRIFRNSKTFG